MKQIINSIKAPAPLGPYNQAILANDTLYVSGQIALDVKTGAFVSDKIQEQTEQVMANLGHILEEAGFSFTDVVKCSIFLASMDDFVSVNEVYGRFFNNETAPARETVAVLTLPKNARVEISCVAVKG